MSIGENIRKLRLQRNLTQKELGDLCGMADSAIRRYESNRANPKIETLEKIAKALGTTPFGIINYDTLSLKPTEKQPINFSHVMSGISPTIYRDMLEENFENVSSEKDFEINYTKDCTDLFEKIFLLNEIGRTKIKEYAEDLSQNPKYRKDTEENDQ